MKEDWDDEAYCLEAVKQDGCALRYVKVQTPEICLAAVEKDWWSLKYVKVQTPDICLTAIKDNWYALQHVKDQTIEIILAAFDRNKEEVLKYIDWNALTKDESDYIKLRYLV